MDGQMKGYIFAVLSSLLMGGAVVINYISLQSINVATFTFFFFGFGLFGAIVSLIVTRKLYITKRLLRIYWKPVVVIGLIGGISAIMWFFALKLVGSATMGFLMRFSTVFTVLIGVTYLKERLNKGEIYGAVMMVVGALVMTFNGSEHIIVGVILALILSAINSLEQLILKKYVKHIEPIAFNALRIVFTFIVIAAYATSTMKVSLPSSKVLLQIFITAIISTVIGFIFYFKALEKADLSKVVLIRAMDPFVIFVFSLLFLGSIPTGYQLVGGIFIGVGAFFLVLARYRPKIIVRLIPGF